MTNEVDKPGVFGTRVNMVDPEALKEALAVSANTDPRGAAADGSEYMNFSGKRGVYEIGLDKRDTTEEELWVVAVPLFQDGYVCWKGGRVIASRLATIGQPIPTYSEAEHGPFDKDGDGWFQAKAMTIKSIDTGQQCYFKINSTSGVSVFASLQKEIIQRLMAGQPYWPVVGFGKEPFMAQGFKNFKPAIVVDGWLSDAQIQTELPAIFADEKAEIDLDSMYQAALGPVPLPTDGDKKDGVARRNRRNL